jgi:nickel/cobalt exporter
LTAITGITLVGRPQAASAHPLGNFTINQYSRIDITVDTISLRYILDMAEIPAFQEIVRIDVDKDTLLSEKERADYLEMKLRELQQGIHLSIGQSLVHLTPMERDMSVPPGQGGLSTLRLNLLLQGEMPQTQGVGEQVLEYRSENYPQRTG